MSHMTAAARSSCAKMMARAVRAPRPSRPLVYDRHPIAAVAALARRTASSSATSPHAHPTKDAPRSPTSGQPVAELAKPDESRKSGVQPGEAPLAHTPTLDLFKLNNRTILVTGGGRGLGLTLAHGFLEAGAHVRCLDILPEPTQPHWDEAASLARSSGLSLEYHRLDITSEDDTASLFAQLFKDAPADAPVRGLYVSAGINLVVPAEEYTAAQFRKVMDINVTGTFLSAQAFAREYFKRHGGDGTLLRAGEGGSVVFTGSMSGHVANKDLFCAPYNASKAGVNQLVKNLAMEWGKRGIRVNSISPGYIQTSLNSAILKEKPQLNDLWVGQSLIGRLSTADEFRGPATYLLSDASSFMTGADMIIDGGHTAT